MIEPTSLRSKPLSIDAALLERMGSLARGFPGRTVSLAQPTDLPHALARKVVLHLDGVAAAVVSDRDVGPSSADVDEAGEPPELDALGDPDEPPSPSDAA